MKADIFKLCPTCRKTTVWVPHEGYRICFGCLVKYETDDPRLITAAVRKLEPWPMPDRYEEIGFDWGYDE